MIDAYKIAKKVRNIWGKPDENTTTLLQKIENVIITASDNGEVMVKYTIANTFNVKLLKKLLEKNGYVVAYSESGNMYEIGIGWEYLIKI